MKTSLSALLVLSALAFGQAHAQAVKAPQKMASPVPGLDASGMTVCPTRNAYSAIQPKPMAHDPRLVVFAYDPNALYPVNTTFNRFTHVQFEAGEKIVGSYINDETEWEQKVSVTGSDILVRPRIKGVQGSLSVITDKRRYQFDLLEISGCAGESRYQRVSWSYAQGSYESGSYEPASTAPAGAPAPTATGVQQTAAPSRAASDAEQGTSVPVFRVDRINSAYEVEGDETLRPQTVMDDGQRTLIKFSSETRLRPVLFAVSPTGDAEAVEYHPSGSAFLVNRVFEHGALLRLGKREVRIRNKASTCGWFDSACRSLSTRNIEGQ